MPERLLVSVELDMEKKKLETQFLELRQGVE